MGSEPANAVDTIRPKVSMRHAASGHTLARKRILVPRSAGRAVLARKSSSSQGKTVLVLSLMRWSHHIDHCPTASVQASSTEGYWVASSSPSFSPSPTSLPQLSCRKGSRSVRVLLLLIELTRSIQHLTRPGRTNPSDNSQLLDGSNWCPTTATYVKTYLMT